MHVSDWIGRVRRVVDDNSPSILSAMAVSGVITTAYLASRATLKASNRISEEVDDDLEGRERAVEIIKVCAPEFVPATASGLVTIGCIVGSNRVSNRRGAAAQAAFVLSERAYHEYRDKVVAEIGEARDAEIRDEIREDRVKASPPQEKVVILHGTTLCCELYTGRYFMSDIEHLRRKQNELNNTMLKHDRMSLAEWQDMLGLTPTSVADDMGWHADRLMELEFTTVLAEDGRPCLAFDYNYVRPLYGGLYD